MSRLAIIDWGIGGMGFYREWIKHIGESSILYFSDSGFTPYGRLSQQDLTSRLNRVIEMLVREHSITHIVIACNAASSVIEHLSIPDITVTGIINPTCQWIKEQNFKDNVIIAGGKITIESQIFPKLLSPLKVQSKIAQPLSALVEAGKIEGEEVEQAIQSIFQDCQTPSDLILACTHYVALKDLIENTFPHLKCHDPIPAIVKELKMKWSQITWRKGTLQCMTTGNLTSLENSTALAFSLDVTKL